MEIAWLVLEYLRVLLSAQMVVGCVILAFLYIFKTEIGSLLSRIAKIKWGPAELSAPQQPADTSSGATIGSQESPQTLPLPKDASLSPDEKMRLVQAFNAESGLARLWEYRYLNYFFVANTKAVLGWLASQPSPTTITVYDAVWQPTITNADQRRTILNVLESHNMVVYDGNLIEVTPKGHEYLGWLRSLNPAGSTEAVPAASAPSPIPSV